jgi:hypothetical protein
LNKCAKSFIIGVSNTPMGSLTSRLLESARNNKQALKSTRETRAAARQPATQVYLIV